MDLLQRVVAEKLVKEEEVDEIKQKADQKEGGVEAVLTEMGVDSKKILEIKVEGSGLEAKTVDPKKITREILDYIPEEAATYYRFVPIGISQGTLEVGIVDAENIEARDALNFVASKIDIPYDVYLITEKNFQEVFEMYQSLSGEVTQALSELETELEDQDGEDSKGAKKKEAESIEDKDVQATRIIEDAPVTKIVATVLRYATEGRASDIHIEPLAENVRVRFRVDGVLGTSLVLPLKVLSAVVARIKILSMMRLDEKRKPQDGRFSAKIDGRRIDFRVSTFPTYYGEKIVMRILDQEQGIKSIDELGLSPRNVNLIKKAITMPYGMILISGPTGSGKTTTLYAMLQELDREHKNILSLEDPVEYNISGISQSQVRSDIGYTFANGLRTTLRQDPDIIMVGEIRDKETAQLAIQAALTGHLVLSTIHTNNALGVVPRLVDMGVDPYLIAPTLNLAIAQRLVSTLCEGAGEPVPIDQSMQMMFEKEFEDLPEQYRSEIAWSPNVYDAKPTSSCPTGTRGRTAIMEVVEVTSEIRDKILISPTEQDIRKIARAGGMLTIKEDAIIKAMAGEIPYQEISTVG